MESLLESFGLPRKPFAALLDALDGAVAGSAALAVRVDADWQPNDVDVWLQVPDLTVAQAEAYKAERGPMGETPVGCGAVVALRGLVHLLFESWGFERLPVDRSGVEAYCDLHRLPCILHISTFQKHDGRRVQVMLCAAVPLPDLLDGFDLTACRVAWQNGTWVEHPTFTGAGACYYELPLEAERSLRRPRQDARIGKYKARGFRVYLRTPL